MFERETETQRLQRNMTLKWLGTHQYNLQKLERYYFAQQTIRDSGLYTAGQLADSDYNRFFKPLNFSGIVIDEPMSYLGGSRASIKHNNEKLEAWANDYFSRRIRPKIAELIKWGSLYGESSFYFVSDKEGLEKKLKVEPIAIVQNGRQMVYFEYSPSDPEEIVSALIYRLIPTVKDNGEEEYISERVWLGATEFFIERGMNGIDTPRDDPAKWMMFKRIPNTLGALPLAQYINPKASDILDFMSIQDKLDKTELELDYTLEYQGFPMIATEAMNADDLKVGPGNILHGGKAERLPPGDTSVLHKRKDDLLASGSKVAASLDLFQEVSAQARSGEAEQHRKEKFYAKLNDKAGKLNPTVARSLQIAALMLSKDSEMFTYETRFIPKDMRPSQEELANAEFVVSLEPNIPVNHKENAEVASIWFNDLDVTHETALARAGVENPQQEAEKVKEQNAPATPNTEAGTLEDDGQRE